MSNIISLTGQPAKLFEVPYCIEQGYVITVEATDADAAERIVKQRLDDEMDVLDGSRRVHHEHYALITNEVRS